jgi:hypothetical protein
MARRVRTPCTWVSGCRYDGYVHVSIAGPQHTQRKPVDACRTHISLVLADFITVSRNIRVKGN